MSTSFHQLGKSLRAMQSQLKPIPNRMEPLADLAKVLEGVVATVVGEDVLDEVAELDVTGKLTKPSWMTEMKLERFLAISRIARTRTGATCASVTSPGTATRPWMACAGRAPV